jgi:hypothetical protein
MHGPPHTRQETIALLRREIEQLTDLGVNHAGAIAVVARRHRVEAGLVVGVIAMESKSAAA